LMCLGIPGRVVEIIDGASGMAVVIVSGARRKVNVALLEDEGVAPDDWVLVHAGFALSKISEQEAKEMLALFEAMSDVFMGNSPMGSSSPGITDTLRTTT